MPTTPRPPKYPLVRYLKVENAYTQQVKAVLEQAAKELNAQILALGDSGNPLTHLQLRAQQASIKAHLRQDFGGDIQSIIREGQKAAAADAVKVIGEYEKELLSALGSADYYDSIVAAEAQRAAAGVNKLMARYTSSYKPLSERVYKANVIANGAIDKAVNVALVTGLSAKDFAKSIKGLIDPKVPGGVSYAAMRTARSEINNANHASSQQRYADSKIVNSVDWHLSTSHPEGDGCDGLAADSPYKVDEVPEKPHPQCLCYTTPGTPGRKEFLDSLLRGDYGDEPWVRPAEESIDPSTLSTPQLKKLYESHTDEYSKFVKAWGDKPGLYEDATYKALNTRRIELRDATLDRATKKTVATKAPKAVQQASAKNITEAFSSTAGKVDPTKLKWGVQGDGIPSAKVLNDREQQAVRRYTGLSYDKMNTVLREGNISKFRLDDSDTWVFDGVQMKTTQMQDIRLIDTVLRRTQTTKDMNLYRSSGMDYMMDAAKLPRGSDPSKLVGARLDNGGFTSSSFLSDQTELGAITKFVDGKAVRVSAQEAASAGYNVDFPYETISEPIRMRIAVPKGTYGADITAYSKEGQAEAEFLFPPNTHYRITGYSVDDKGRRWLDLVVENGEDLVLPPGA